MADIKTHLRELSVATTVGLLNANINFKVADLYYGEKLYTYAKHFIKNNIFSAQDIRNYCIFPKELQIIIDNGYKLGVEIYNDQHFDIGKNAVIQWLGNDTQKKDPIDVIIGNYSFSLKEESFILKNMGLYQLLNSLTGSTYRRGLHVFDVFAYKEYNDWFFYTWNLLIEYLKQNLTWVLDEKNNHSEIKMLDKCIVLSFNGISSIIPIKISTVSEYMQKTVSLTREKVFSKWINKEISRDTNYLRAKKICSETAGKYVSEIIQKGYNPINVYDFFQIINQEYYYAKTTSSETIILRVPSQQNFKAVIEFIGCRYEVPGSQLNIISTFRNKKTMKVLEFRNECRFSHGQFNGTPEAKMYASKTTSLADLYEPI